jgi:hypothetical protein
MSYLVLIVTWGARRLFLILVLLIEKMGRYTEALMGELFYNFKYKAGLSKCVTKPRNQKSLTNSIL